MCHRGNFREDIYKKCILCKKEDNNIKYVINESMAMKELNENSYEILAYADDLCILCEGIN